FLSYVSHRYLHSFPTRRSSDLSFIFWSTNAEICWGEYSLPPTLIQASPFLAGIIWKGATFRNSSISFKSFWELKLLPINRLTSKDRKSTRLNSSHSQISYAVFC